MNRRFLCILWMTALLAGCAQPVRRTPESHVTVPTAFEEQSAESTAPAAETLSRWWTVWQDPALDTLIANALETNADIRTARARVAEARAVVTIAESTLYPTVAAQGNAWIGAADWRLPALPAAIPAGLAPDISHEFHGGFAGLGASWEADVFGGRRADVAAARAMAAGADQLLNGARMTVAADIAQNYQEARGLQLRLELLDNGISTLEQMLSYVEARYSAGQAFADDADRVRAQIELQRAKRAPLLALLESRWRRLAVLGGKPPENASLTPPSASFNIPAAPAGILPVQVLERRPDVQAKAALVQMSAARLQSAQKDLLPRFGIQFLGGDGTLHFDGLPNFGASGGLINLTAYLPVFTAGRVRANIAASDARLNAAAAEYDAAVLHALEDVENAYRFRTALDERRDSLANALASARRNEVASAALYESGRKTLRDVLDDRISALSDEDELVQSEMGRATATVQLYRALGGGW